MRKEIDLGHGLYKYVEVEEQSVSEQMQDELEPIFHPTQHDESDDIEEAKEVTEQYQIQTALARPVVNKKRSVWGSWNETAEKGFFKGEKWEYKNDS